MKKSLIFLFTFLISIAMQCVGNRSDAFVMYNVSNWNMLLTWGSTNSYMRPLWNSSTLDWSIYNPNSDWYYTTNPSWQWSMYRIFSNMNYNLVRMTSSTCDNNGYFSYASAWNNINSVGQANWITGWYMTNTSSSSPTVQIYSSNSAFWQCVSYNIAGITYSLNWEWIDFIYQSSTPWRQVYSLPSRAGSSVSWQWSTYNLTNVVPYMNSRIFFDDDDNFFMQVSAWWAVANWFLVTNPSLTEDNIFYVAPRMWKAWSTTISTTASWQYLFGIKRLDSAVDNISRSKSYTITRGWNYIFPPWFAPSYYWEQWIIYTEDLSFIAPPDSAWNTTWDNVHYSAITQAIDSVKNVLSNAWNVICKSTNGANIYQNDFEKYLWTYAYYQRFCDANVYAPTPYDDWWTRNHFTLQWLFTRVKQSASDLLSFWTYSNNDNVCRYAEYLSGRVNAFINSIDCNSCDIEYLRALQSDYWTNVIDSNNCIVPTAIKENVVTIDWLYASWTLADPSYANSQSVASKLLETFYVPFMSGYQSVVVPTCFAWESAPYMNYLLYWVFAIYIYLLFKLLH